MCMHNIQAMRLWWIARPRSRIVRRLRQRALPICTCTVALNLSRLIQCEIRIVKFKLRMRKKSADRFWSRSKLAQHRALSSRDESTHHYTKVLPHDTVFFNHDLLSHACHNVYKFSTNGKKISLFSIINKIYKFKSEDRRTIALWIWLYRYVNYWQ